MTLTHRSAPSGLHPVHILGAGPGDPELLTLKAARLLAHADVVLCDALVNPEVLVHCREDARVLDVGKLGYNRHTPQEVICRILVDEARAGHRVVRLKGGDPFVFGRGGEEALFLAKHGIPFTVVPGISSSVGAAAAANIPVTHRGISQSFTVVTGTAARDERLLAKQWEALADAGGTLVFLMALRPLARISEKLLSAGMDPDMPCAMIQAGTREDMRVVDGTVSTIAARVQGANLGSPALLVVGQVCSVRTDLRALAQLAHLEPAAGAALAA